MGFHIDESPTKEYNPMKDGVDRDTEEESLQGYNDEWVTSNINKLINSNAD